MESFLFYFFSGLAILSAMLVIALPKPTRALLSLMVTMFSLAVLYLVLGAPFLAMAQLMVYAGAVLVVFLFVIMLQGTGAQDIALKQRFPLGYLSFAAVVAIGLFLAFALFLRSHPFDGSVPLPRQLFVGTIERIGQSLFDRYLIPFELPSALLLLGILAAVALAKNEGP